MPLFLFPRGASADLAQQAEQLTCNHQVISSIQVVGTICGYRIMAITSAFQADDAGSIPATRSRETSLIAALAYFYCVGTVFYLSSGYGSKPVIVTVLIFLQQRNGALSVEI